MLSKFYRLIGSPESPAQVKNTVEISKITDRNLKLKAYRLEKNTRKFKEIQEQKSPFIVAVPVGRWVEKKERARPFRVGLNETPVRAALMSERVLKKSTVKDLMLKSTIKKENRNVMMFGKTVTKPQAAKSKKKILVELNAVPHVVQNKDDTLSPLKPLDLDNTFEILPDLDEMDEIEPIKHLRRSSSLPEIIRAPKAEVQQKILTPPPKSVVKKEHMRRVKPIVKEPIKKPVVVKKEAPAIIKTTRKIVQAKRILKVKVKDVELKVSPKLVQQEASKPQAKSVAQSKPAAKKKEPARSSTYTLYKSSLNIQISYLTMHIQDIISNKSMFFDVLPEDRQMSIDEVIQQGNLLITDKLKKFGEFLEQFEEGHSRPEDPKRVTDDDVENYWYLIYEEIEKLKGDLSRIQEEKKRIMAATASQKRKRTRRTFVPDVGTPKRSIRIAENADTPK